MKITQKHIQYILLLLIVLIAVGAYYFGYVGFVEKADAIKQSNKAIDARINELNEKETHRGEWQEAIDKTDESIKALLAKYGPGNTPEKSIIFVKSLEDAAGMSIPSIAFTPDSVLFVSEDYNEDGTPKVEIDTSMITVNYSTTYSGLKACMDYINNYSERMNVNSFSAGYDQESGQLTGSMVINLFGVKDADHEYHDPVIAGINLGVDNIFGNVDFTPVENNIDNTAESTADNADTGEATNGEGEQSQETGEGTPE